MCMLTWADLFVKIRRADIAEKGSVFIVKFKNNDNELYYVRDIEHENNKMIIHPGNECINYVKMLIKAKDIGIWGIRNYNPDVFVKFENELLPAKEIYFDDNFDIVLTV